MANALRSEQTARALRPDWAPLTRPGCRNVQVSVLLVPPAVPVGVAVLRFAEDATTDEHEAAHEIDVVCLKGEGYVCIAQDQFPFRSGDVIGWPASVRHRLWTDAAQTTTRHKLTYQDRSDAAQDCAARGPLARFLAPYL